MVDDNRPIVAQTPLSQRGKSLQSDFLGTEGGLATNVGTFTRQPDEFRVLNNLQQLVRGVWTSVGIGWARERNNNFNSGNPFYEFSYFIDSAGTKTLLFQNGTKLYSYNLSTHTETQISGTGTLPSSVPCMRRFFSSVSGNSCVVLCNTAIQPLKVTSVTAAGALQFNGSPWPGTFNAKSYGKPGLCEAFGANRMAYGRFDAASTAFDILISNQGSPEAFTVSAPVVATDAVAFTYPPELGQLVSLRAHRLTDQNLSQILIGGCTDGIFIITGTDATNFALKILTPIVGVCSNRGWIQISNDLYFPSTTGFRTYSSILNNQILNEDAISRKIQDLYNLIDPANFDKIFAVHHPSTQEIQWWVPLTTDNGVVQHAFIASYNNENSKQGVIMPQWSTKSDVQIACGIEFKGVMYGGGYGAGTGIATDGLLQKHYSGNTYDGTPIKFALATALITMGNISQKCSMRNLSIATDGGDQSFTINAFVYRRQTAIDGEGAGFSRVSAEPTNQKLSAGVGQVTQLDAWPLGVAAFPSTGPKVLDFQPKGNGNFWDVEITSTDDTDTLDYAGLQYTLSGGSLQR